MSYRNRLAMFGHLWIEKEAIDIILDKFPEQHYSVVVTFTGKPDLMLRECTGKETDIDSIMIYYKDGTDKLDPEPFRWHVTGPVNAMDFLHSTVGDSNPITYFFNRSKGEHNPQTRNESPEDVAAIRSAVRRKFVNFVHMNGIEDSRTAGDGNAPLSIPVNCFKPGDRNNLLRFIETLDCDGIQVYVDVRFDRSSIDQLQRLDTEMECGDIGDVLEYAEASGSEMP